MRRSAAWGAAALLTIGCGQNPDIVTARLVDLRDSRAWHGTALRLVEVHQTPMAPFPGMERLWRRVRHDRVDTVPGVRTFGPVTVVGETQVLGFHGEDDGGATVFQYDALSHTLTQSALPRWFRDAVFDPPPALAPGGGHVIFLASRPGGMVRVEVRAWPGGDSVAVGPTVRLNPKGADATSVLFGFGAEFTSLLPIVTDSGAYWLLIRGRVPDGRIDESRQPAVPAAPVSAFTSLPGAFQAELNERGCNLPQSDSSNNWIQGHVGAAQQNDWAALCSRRGQSQIVVYWGGPAQCPRELQLASDDKYTVFDGSRVEFRRSLHTRNRFGGRGPEHQADPGQLQWAHDAIEDSHDGGERTVWFCQAGAWRRLSVP